MRRKKGRGCFLLGWVGEVVVVGVAAVRLVLAAVGGGNGTKNGADDGSNGVKICRRCCIFAKHLQRLPPPPFWRQKYCFGGGRGMFRRRLPRRWRQRWRRRWRWRSPHRQTQQLSVPVVTCVLGLGVCGWLSRGECWEEVS